jgi:N-acetylglucosaminyl-diphospho-decaprenol L-rhamnosyltransferase
MSGPDLEIIIVSYQVRRFLSSCLASLYGALAADGLHARVQVLDNASDDGSADMVAAEYPQVELVRNSLNIGYARGVNLGLRRLGYPIAPVSASPVLLLNPDTEVLPGSLRWLVDDLGRLPRAGLVGPGLRFGDGSLQHSAFHFPGLVQTGLEFFPIHWRLRESKLNGRFSAAETGSAPFRCDHPLGAAMLLRSQALTEIGLFDDGYFMYCEEIDWCWRAARLGWEIWSDPRAVIVHHAGRSSAQFRQAMFVELWRSRYRLFSKQRGRAFQGAARGLVRLGLAYEMARARRQVRAGELSPVEFAERMAAWRTVWAL